VDLHPFGTSREHRPQQSAGAASESKQSHKLAQDYNAFNGHTNNTVIPPNGMTQEFGKQQHHLVNVNGVEYEHVWSAAVTPFERMNTFGADASPPREDKYIMGRRVAELTPSNCHSGRREGHAPVRNAKSRNTSEMHSIIY